MKDITIEINKNNLFNPYNTLELNKELGNYLYEKCKISDLNKEIKINVNVNKNIDLDDNQITYLFKDYFEENLFNKIEKQKKENILLLILSFIGILFLLIYYLINYKELFIISEIFLIIGWVIIWEVCYKVFFSRNFEDYEIRKYQKLLKAEITFIR